jgi:phage terminase small subunit
LLYTCTYKAAGYATKTGDVADACASRLLGNAKVDARVKELLAGAADKAQVSASRVMAELARIGFADIHRRPARSAPTSRRRWRRWSVCKSKPVLRHRLY